MVLRKSYNIHYINIFVQKIIMAERNLTEKIIGISKQKGNYQGIDYCNYYINSQYQNANTKGTCVHLYKIKEKNMIKLLDSYFHSNPDRKPSDLIGYYIENPYNDIYYDQQKNIMDIRLSKEDPSEIE